MGLKGRSYDHSSVSCICEVRIQIGILKRQYQKSLYYTRSAFMTPSSAIIVGRWRLRFRSSPVVCCSHKITLRIGNGLALREKGYDEFLPFYRGKRAWSDR